MDTVQVRIFIKKARPKKCKFAEYRNWVMANYFLATGNRLRTVLNISFIYIITSFDFRRGLILIA